MIDTATIAISLLALFSSMHSCNIAKEANRLSVKSFIIENRPLVSVDILPSQTDTNRYYDVVQSGGILFLVLRFELENKGYTPAECVHVLPDSRMEITVNNNPDLTGIAALGEYSSRFSIAPGEVYELTCRRPIEPMPNADLGLSIAALTSNLITLRSEIHLTYESSDLDKRLYRTRVRHEYSNDSKPYILLSEFQDITASRDRKTLNDIVTSGTNQIHDVFSISILRSKVNPDMTE